MYCVIRTEFKRKHCCPTFKNIKIIPHRDKRKVLDLHKTLFSLYGLPFTSDSAQCFTTACGYNVRRQENRCVSPGHVTEATIPAGSSMSIKVREHWQDARIKCYTAWKKKKNNNSGKCGCRKEWPVEKNRVDHCVCWIKESNQNRQSGVVFCPVTSPPKHPPFVWLPGVFVLKGKSQRHS